MEDDTNAQLRQQEWEVLEVMEYPWSFDPQL